MPYTEVWNATFIPSRSGSDVIGNCKNIISREMNHSKCQTQECSKNTESGHCRRYHTVIMGTSNAIQKIFIQIIFNRAYAGDRSFWSRMCSNSSLIFGKLIIQYRMMEHILFIFITVPEILLIGRVIFSHIICRIQKCICTWSDGQMIWLKSPSEYQSESGMKY